MSDPLLIPMAPDSHNTDGVTAEWVPAPSPVIAPGQDAPTATYQPLPTSGPQNPLRQTLAHDPQLAKANPQFPILPGMTVVDYLDSGGMGHVYLAEQETPKRTVAVKIATSANRAGMVARERFDREIQALAAVAHPNIMPIYTAGDWHGFPYYSMRYMAGGALSRQLERFAGRPKAGATLMRKVARGMQALHEAKIIHRDLKPHNILLDEHDEPVIADFGLAKWTDGSSELTVTASALGTKYYMPPEQTVGSKEEYGPASDIWSFGVILYEMLTGTRPFREELKPALYDQIRGCEPVIPGSVPVGLATIIRRCLQKSHSDRYPSAAALGEDLDRWLDGAPIDPRKPRPAAKPKRRVGRMVAIGVALAVVASLAALTAAVWPAKQKSIAERLRAGETVTLIGEKGMPSHRTMPGNRLGHLAEDLAGHCEIGTSDVAVIELGRDTDMPDFLLRGEVSITIGTHLSRFGVYAAREEWDEQDGLHQSMFLARFNGPPNKVWRFDFPAGRCSPEAMHLTPKTTVQHVFDLARGEDFNPPPLPRDDNRVWREMSISVTSTAITQYYQSVPASTVPTEEFAERMAFLLDRRVTQRPAPNDPRSGGWGLYVEDGKSAFRNVTISPYPR